MSGREHPGLPIVLATGYAELPPRALPPSVPRIAKPFRQQQLLDVVTRAVVR